MYVNNLTKRYVAAVQYDGDAGNLPMWTTPYFSDGTLKKANGKVVCHETAAVKPGSWLVSQEVGGAQCLTIIDSVYFASAYTRMHP